MFNWASKLTILILLSGLCFYANPQSPTDGRVLLHLRHETQELNLCVPTSASMILAYYGDYHDPVELKALATPRVGSKFEGTYYKDMVGGVRKLGYVWKAEQYSTDDAGFAKGLATLKQNLREYHPAMVNLNIPPIGHTVVIVGYDDSKKELTFLDPNRRDPGLWTMSESEFKQLWREMSANIRAAVFTTRKP